MAAEGVALRLIWFMDQAKGAEPLPAWENAESWMAQIAALKIVITLDEPCLHLLMILQPGVPGAFILRAPARFRVPEIAQNDEPRGILNTFR
ncbi:hypothetical protein BH11ARM2_BH11ARM2_16870 [soil metagenome]